MTSLRTLRVSALVAAGAVLAVACGDDGMSASGLSGGSQSAGQLSTGGSSGYGTSGETSESSPTTSGNSAAESTSDDATTVPGTSTSGFPDTTTDVPGTSTTNDPTNDPTNNPTNDPTNPAQCGNGVIDGNEQCDGANLNGFTCEALGNAGGTLQCDPVTCTFDTQMCEGGGGTSG